MEDDYHGNSEYNINHHGMNGLPKKTPGSIFLKHLAIGAPKVMFGTKCLQGGGGWASYYGDNKI